MLTEFSTRYLHKQEKHLNCNYNIRIVCSVEWLWNLQVIEIQAKAVCVHLTLSFYFLAVDKIVG